MRYFIIFLFLFTFTITTSANRLSSYIEQETIQKIDSQNQQRQQQRDKIREAQLNTEKEVKFQIRSSRLYLPQEETPCYPIQKITLKDYNSSNQKSQFKPLLQETFKELNLTFPHCLGGEGLNIVMKQLQNNIIKQGFVTSRVVASPQDLHSGILELTVIKGRVRHFIVADSSNIPRFSSLSAWTAMALKSGDVLNVRDIEQSLENLKRVPTAEANIEILPAQGNGIQVGESDLKISYTQAFPIRLTLGLDDSGSRSTGKFQGSATLSFDNLLTGNDLFYASYTHSLKTKEDDKGKRGTHNLSLHYSFPVGYWLFSLDHSQNQYYQEVFGAFQNYIYSGKSKTEKVNASYTLYRDNKRKTSLWGGVWVRNSNSFIDHEKIDVQHRHTGGWQVGIKYQHVFENTTLNLGLSYKRGTGAFGAISAPEELFNEGTSRFKLIFANLSLTTPFKVAESHWQHSLRFNGQYNRTPLTSQDRFSIGGRYSVRGFNGELTLSGNKGWTVQNDITWIINPTRQFYLGIDYGKVYQQQSDSLGNELMGMALGLKGMQWGINYDVFFGVPLYKPKGFRTSDVVTAFNISYQF
ncbi:hemolysin activation/secretion protein [Bisgaardia hudsonensis]|uniref:Hemolysin activation/secretion protein n=1 Tax=Bisgaardia hudsonensis TaxID=109472 RepID=A0A4R2MUA0_9PAST|nr:ShlB/FhaC/HecB family hemolysin secretion/activation protein [Bisgaardia hudsonensis]QLB12912.1 peptide transporter [Bisgaardia hudsonensis]TCP11326.1 hemolysin activation/secretion protein [Bisgaardia hudsonensis]